MKKPAWSSENRSYIQLGSKYYYGVPRRLRQISTGIVLLIVLGILLHIARNERDFALKQWPTVFASLSHPPRPGSEPGLWHAPQPIRHQNGTHIDDRYVFMRYLGKGQEGSASLYVDETNGEVVVLKTYRGIPRNPVPSELAADFPDYASPWQVEIEASLHMGQWKNGNETAFVPVRDYFVLQPGAGSEVQKWQWALVTPFIEDGTLETLAEKTRVHERTPQKLDKIFRSVFESVLGSLKLMHDQGFCHDDIKSDNIFVADTKHWLVGDLGNVRHFEHPWHDTRRWKRENQWPNCVHNDIRRMMKTYMTFLRDACGDRWDFDGEFYKERQAWSQLYWEYMREPVDVAATLDLSSIHDSTFEAEWRTDVSVVTDERQKSCLKRKIDLELTTMTVHRRPSDYWLFRAC